MRLDALNEIEQLQKKLDDAIATLRLAEKDMLSPRWRLNHAECNHFEGHCVYFPSLEKVREVLR